MECTHIFFQNNIIVNEYLLTLRQKCLTCYT
uniref:Uncharacterized protein n=1 Tax=viral metagenome TaxID=1070528 RepID=A0A6C0EIJ0_9ZZZZ